MFDSPVAEDHPAEARPSYRQTGRASDLLAEAKGHSFLSIRKLMICLWISVLIHLAMVAAAPAGGLDLDRMDLWWLTAIDTLLLALVLAPLAAVVRRELPWYDPVAILSVVYLLMSSLFYLALMLDPLYVVYRIVSFGRMGMMLTGMSGFLRLVSQAELLLLVSLLIVLFINRYSLDFRSYSPSPRESRAASVAFLICAIAGMFGWLIYWSQRSFFDAATVSLGDASVKVLESGTARYIILGSIGVTSITLGIAGGYGFLSRDSRRVRTGLLVLMIAATVLANLPSGSRVEILAGAALLFYVSSLFGYRVGRSAWSAGILVGIGLLLAVTFVRGNRFVSDEPTGVLEEFVSGEAGTTYFRSLDSPVAVLFATDRVSAVSVVLQHFAGGGEYLYGQTLIAGIANLSGDFASRLGFDNPIARTPLLWANEQILVWFFGAIVPGGALPPSIPGEFYMQGGWVAVLALSALSGLMLKWMRERLARPRSLLERWFLGVLLFRLCVLVPVEVSGLTSVLLYTLPVLFLYKLVFVLSADSTTTGHKWQTRSL